MVNIVETRRREHAGEERRDEKSAQKGCAVASSETEDGDGNGDGRGEGGETGEREKRRGAGRDEWGRGRRW